MIQRIFPPSLPFRISSLHSLPDLARCGPICRPRRVPDVSGTRSIPENCGLNLGTGYQFGPVRVRRRRHPFRLRWLVFARSGYYKLRVRPGCLRVADTIVMTCESICTKNVFDVVVKCRDEHEAKQLRTMTLRGQNISFKSC